MGRWVKSNILEVEVILVEFLMAVTFDLTEIKRRGQTVNEVT